MHYRATSALVCCITSAACAQPATAIRFENGASTIAAAPGSAVRVSIYATNLPAIGKPIHWTAYPGGLGYYAGFLSATMDVNAATTSPVTWFGLTIPPENGFMEPPWGSAGTQVGSGVRGIVIGVGFNRPVTGHDFLLWQGTVTVGTSNVSLATQIQPVGAPPQTGFEIALSGMAPPPYNVSSFMQTLNSTALITVPAPTTLAMSTLALARIARRRR